LGNEAEEFRRKANEFEAKAEEALNPIAKQAYVELARYWRELAEETENRK
jgi:hypothetical protein